MEPCSEPAEDDESGQQDVESIHRIQMRDDEDDGGKGSEEGGGDLGFFIGSELAGNEGKG